MAPLSFQERVDTGRYEELAPLFDEDSEALAVVDYGTNFKAASRAWRAGDTKNFTTTFSLTDDPRQELVVNLIGEVSPDGTELSARGNAWLKANQVIVDKTSVKDVLVLNLPSLATPSLQVIWDNQVRTLESIIEADLPVPLVRLFLLLCTLLFTMPCRPRRSIAGHAPRTTTERPSLSLSPRSIE